jgi:chitin disaccharide deacetylase
MGTRPTHLDSHHNVHRDRRLLPLFLELAQEHSLPMREHSPVRYFSAFYGQWGGEAHLEQIGVEMLERMLSSEAGEGLTELSCHPGRVDPDLLSSYSFERETELRTLCAPAIRSLLGDLGISLIAFRDVPQVLAGASSSQAAR